MTARLIFTTDGKRFHIGIGTKWGLRPICETPTVSIWRSLNYYRSLGVDIGRHRTMCARCPSVAADMCVLAASTEER